MRQHNALRGLKLLFGAGWPANEGRPRGGKWENDHICVDAEGKPIGEPYYQHACQGADTYWELARMNLDKLDFSYEQVIGIVIAYGETHRTRGGHCGCARCAHLSGAQKFINDFDFVTTYLAEKGHTIPVGFMEATWGGPGSPVADALIAHMPAGSFMAMNPFRQDDWRFFGHWYEKLPAANAAGKRLNVFQGVEVNNLITTDVPLFRPSVLETQHGSFATVPRAQLVGSFTGHNTSQYMSWLHMRQLFGWQWRFDPDRPWLEDVQQLLADVFGSECGQLTAQAIDKLLCLEYHQPYVPWQQRQASLGRWDPWRTVGMYTQFTPKPYDKWKDANLLHVLDERWQRWSQLSDLADSIQADLGAARQAASSGEAIYDQQVAHVLDYTTEFCRSRLRWGQALLAAMHAKRHASATPADLPGALTWLRRAVELVEQSRQAGQRYEAMIDRPEGDYDFALPPAAAEVNPRVAEWQALIEANDAARIAAYRHYNR